MKQQILLSIRPAGKSGNGKMRYTLSTDTFANPDTSYSKAELFLLIAKEVDKLND